MLQGESRKSVCPLKTQFSTHIRAVILNGAIVNESSSPISLLDFPSAKRRSIFFSEESTVRFAEEDH